MDYLEVCLIFKCLQIFLLSFCYWVLIWIYYGQKILFYDPRYSFRWMSHVWETNVCSCVWRGPQGSSGSIGWWAPQVCRRSVGWWVPISPILRILSPVVLSVAVRDIMKSPARIVDLSISFFSFIQFASYILKFCIHIWDCPIFLVDSPLLLFCNVLHSSYNFLLSEIFLWYQYSYSCLFGLMFT